MNRESRYETAQQTSALYLHQRGGKGRKMVSLFGGGGTAGRIAVVAAPNGECFVCSAPWHNDGPCDECRKLAVSAMSRDPAAIARLATMAGRPTTAVRKAMCRRPINGKATQTLHERVAELGQQIAPPVSWTLPEAQIRLLGMEPRFVR